MRETIEDLPPELRDVARKMARACEFIVAGLVDRGVSEFEAKKRVCDALLTAADRPGEACEMLRSLALEAAGVARA